MGKYQKNIEAARRITVMQYLETYHPGELVRKTDREYCTRTHDSLIITPANGFFHWFSRNVGGNNAIDCCRGWNKPRNAALYAKNDNKTSSAKENTPINELDFLCWFFYHEIIHISFVDFLW